MRKNEKDVSLNADHSRPFLRLLYFFRSQDGVTSCFSVDLLSHLRFGLLKAVNVRVQGGNEKIERGIRTKRAAGSNICSAIRTRQLSAGK